MTVTFPDASDMMAANRRQSETLLYPMDAMILSAADAADATLVSFDSELPDRTRLRITRFGAHSRLPLQQDRI
ncbi:PilT protein domain-containing protein [Halorubrum californiense DSM 19288]|uniref:PilT protein domain-containing protein n=1 Tax=Halorubrum californiense DSM 19288 TaxID=1227465 RepID=M0EIS5_9EURY|nr:PilT protein domain-containing protein [Halorubrum californiense DSM 19288]